jgi:hypothetical protein
MRRSCYLAHEPTTYWEKLRGAGGLLRCNLRASHDVSDGASYRRLQGVVIGSSSSTWGSPAGFDSDGAPRRIASSCTRRALLASMN